MADPTQSSPGAQLLAFTTHIARPPSKGPAEPEGHSLLLGFKTMKGCALPYGGCFHSREFLGRNEHSRDWK